MAIDEGGDPNKVKNAPQYTPRPPAEQRVPVPVSSHRISVNKSSTSSASSWPEVVENMHHGRPAHSSDGDPFGARSQLNSLKKTGGGRVRDGGTGGRHSSQNPL